jgi:hypothetical protein
MSNIKSNRQALELELMEDSVIKLPSATNFEVCNVEKKPKGASRKEKKAVFRHLLRHYRVYKLRFLSALREPTQNPIQIACNLGAIECLYFQALGNGELNLAKGIVRFIEATRHQHDVSVSTIIGK